MAVESRRATYLAPHLIQNRMPVNNDVCMNNGVMLDGFLVPANVQLPYVSPSFNLPQNQLVIGGVGSNNGTRKRSRDQMDVLFGASVSQQLNQLHADSDRIIAEHIKKMKVETEIRFKRQMRLIVTAFRDQAINKIKEQEAKIQQMNQMNAALLDKTVTLSMENQVWRNLAKEKEETANTLRDNLVQMIAHPRITLGEVVPGHGGADDDCHSFCGSNNVVEGEQQEVEMLPATAGVGGGVVASGGRMCLSCGRMESCVLLLPCRHLCLCQVCGTALPTACGVCGTDCNGSIRVNLC